MATRKKIKTRRWTENDIPALMECQSAAYADYVGQSYYDERVFQLQLAAFPEGQYLAETPEGQVVGYACSIIVQVDDALPTLTWSEITGDATFSTHTPAGDTLYGADIAVHPDYRGQGIAGLLYKERMALLRRYNLRRMMAHGRLPGYHRFGGKITPEEYVERVERGEIKDSALNAHLKIGYRVKKIFYDYMKDASSHNYSTLLELDNPTFRPERRRIAASPLRSPARLVRVCAAQYKMSSLRDLSEFEHSVNFFIDSADTYHSHFLVLPELFTAQLFSIFPRDLDDREAILRLADMTDWYREFFSEAAKRHGMYIVAGSHPVSVDGQLQNVAHLFTPTGKFYTQAKLHVTTAERRWWGITPGDELKLFRTPLGRVAIQICYDIEFPETARILALAGAEIIFVPFSTDEKKAYTRVRTTAAARAIENYLYVVIAGNTGNLPQVRSYIINYSQTAILTPSDFSFPAGAVLGEAGPDSETVVIADLDLSSLMMQREIATVKPVIDRRTDLYEIRPLMKLQIVETD